MSASAKSFNEKRDFIRMKINSTLKITHEGRSYSAVCKDISGAGMSAQCSNKFTIGDTVDILIEQENEHHLPFHASAEVSRVQDDNADGYIIGFSIKDITD